jgi:hypothetical protein
MELAGMVRAWASCLPDGMAFAFNPPPIQGLGQAGGFEVYVQGRGRRRPAAPGAGDAGLHRRAGKRVPS